MSGKLTNKELRLLIVGDYLFEPQVGMLSGPSGAHHICFRLATLLSCLVERSNEVVDRDYLTNKLWHDEPCGSRSLTQCVGQLRHYFGDTARAANYIETVPNRGYRLVAAVYGSTSKPESVKAAVEPRRQATAGNRFASIIQEFRERKVCRSMLIYTIVIWLVFQVSEIVVPALNMPEWVISLVVVLGILGFPVAAMLSWIFDLTPTGLIREQGHTMTVTAGHAHKPVELMFDVVLVVAAVAICIMLVVSSMGASSAPLSIAEAHGATHVYMAQVSATDYK